ncbi:MAG: hypothetical protein IPK60_06115 [Sandaracinaceae bacterium]|nr:hypothetical protein [Sandaracinaceae bacterium]
MKRLSISALLLALALTYAPARAQDFVDQDSTTPRTGDEPTAPVETPAGDSAATEGAANAEAVPAAQDPAAAGASGPTVDTADAAREPEAPPSSGIDAEILGGRMPLRFQMTGWFRSRIVSGNGFPTENFSSARAPDPSINPSFAYMRGHIEPSITYGSVREMPVVALRTQFDLLNNVVFGDNARLSGTPLFTEQPSGTDINGIDVPPIQLRRAWLEVNIPIGQIRVGRMGAYGGLGILFNDGNGFRNDWGDANTAAAFDRVLFATQPLTIIRALATGDTRPTPLILAVTHDWLVEDPLGLGAQPNPTRSTFPFATLGNGADDVEETILYLQWLQKDINPLRSTDILDIGMLNIYRTQQQTETNVYVGDLFWKIRYAFLGNRAPSLFFNGEVTTILGSSRGLPLGPGQFLDAEGRTPNVTTSAVWGGVVQLGAAAANWIGTLEAGYARGDHNIFSSTTDYRLDQRVLNPDYHVGLIMYQVALAGRTANAYAAQLGGLQSRGGVWNSKYFFPQFRYTVVPGLDLHGAFLLAWADQLNEAFPSTVAAREAAGSTRMSCKVFEGDCFLGWEADLAVKVSWGENDVMRWSTEFGMMNAGGALALELQQSFIWTLQSRIAMVF